MKLRALALAFVIATPTAAETFVVDRLDDPPGPAFGCLESNPEDCSLRGAVLRANLNPGFDRVQLGAGTHTLLLAGPDENGNALGDLDLQDDLEIVGEGAAATEILPGFVQDRLIHLLSSHAPDVTLRGVRLRGAQNAGSFGGAVACEGGSLSLVDVSFVDNVANVGGGIWAGDGCAGVSIERSTFDHNTAAANTDPGAGGGLYSRSPVELQHVDFIDNWAAEDGGGLAVVEASLLVESSSFVDNDARRGAGLFAADSVIAIAGSVVRGNQAIHNNQGVGGGLYLERSTASIRGTEIASNLANQSSGAIHFLADGQAGLELALVDSTLGSNSAPLAAGARVTGPTALLLLHVTIHDQAGDGLGLRTTLVDLELANNLFGDPCSFLQGTNELSLGGNLEAATDTCRLAPPLDAHSVVVGALALGPLIDNGGNSRTFALGETSLALGFAVAPECSPRDQRGAPRDAADCDSGAFQLVPGFLYYDGFESGGAAPWSSVAP